MTVTTLFLHEWDNGINFLTVVTPVESHTIHTRYLGPYRWLVFQVTREKCVVPLAQ
jgi:hypothetical protein